MMTTMRKKLEWAAKLKSQMVIDSIFWIHRLNFIFNFDFFFIR